MMKRYEIRIPGTFVSDAALLDLETGKVPTGGHRMANGENLANRWTVIMAGVARDGRISVVDAAGDEAGALEALSEILAGTSEVVYGATREFDEMICRGRFTNARRAHEVRPVFPAVPGAESLRWQNVGVGKSGYVSERGTDVPSRDVPKAYRRGGRDGWERVAVHLLRDVADLILEAGYPSADCAAWCRKILADYDYALSYFRR